LANGGGRYVVTGPRLALVLVVAGIAGLALGTGLGNATKLTPALAVVASPSTVPAKPSPIPSSSPTAFADLTASPSLVDEPSGTPEVIFSIEGNKHEVTDSFKAKPGWQIEWQIEGDAIAVAVTGKPNLGVVINQKGPSSGVAGIADGGKFALNIVATGPWKITVIEGEDPSQS
jgi:hypothetical protein